MNQPNKDICEKAKRTLLELDSNGDGKVSLEEFKAAWRDTYDEEALEEAVRLVNTNDDCYISVDEFFIRIDGKPPCN